MHARSSTTMCGLRAATSQRVHVWMGGRVFACLMAGMGTAHAQQWYTGSLVSPSGVMSRPGALNVEPYYSYSQPLGTFDTQGAAGPARHPMQRMFANSTLWKYGITKDFSVQMHTVIDYGWKNGTDHSHGPKFGDFPVDLIYCFVRPDPVRYIPAFNLFAGMIFPTGDYSHLGHAQDGIGTGAYVFRVALTEQSTYTLPGNHALRLRMWNWFRRAVSSAALHDVTSYGTTQGFRGRGRPGMSGEAGFSLEYGITRKWVLATDVAYDWANGSYIHGRNAGGQVVNRVGSASGDWQVAPAVEYNWNARWGVIAGSSFYYAGHNKSIQVSPQLAINAIF